MRTAQKINDMAIEDEIKKKIKERRRVAKRITNSVTLNLMSHHFYDAPSNI